MNYQRCICPRCSTPLRVKDRTYLNRPIPCPACRSLLVLNANEDATLEAVLSGEPDQASPAKPARARPKRAQPTLVQRSLDWSPNATVVSWVATLIVAAMIGIVALWPKRPPSGRASVLPPDTDVAAQLDPPPTDEPTTLEASTLEASNLEPTPLEPAISEPSTPRAEPASIEVAEAPDDPPRASDVDRPADAESAIPPADAAAAVVQATAAANEAAPALPPAVDFETALAQPIAAFRQSRAIPRRELLDLLEEMLGAPIRYDAAELGEAANRLDQKISFDLEDVTVGDILARVLHETEISYDRERDALRLRKSSSDRPVPDNGTP